MRNGLVTSTLVITLVTTIVPATAQTQCNSGLVTFHSTASTKRISTGMLGTTDGSVLIAVDKPKEPAASHWRVESGLIGGQHDFVKEGQSFDEDRIDTSLPYQKVQVDFYDSANSDVCTIAENIAAIPSTGKGSLIFILPDKRAWHPIRLDDMQIDPAISLVQPFAAFDGTELHINGRLVVVDKIQSRRLVDFHIGPRVVGLTSGGSIPFDVYPAGNNLSNPYTININDLVCQSQGKWKCGYTATLDFPDQGQKPIALMLAPDGVFKMAAYDSANPLKITWKNSGDDSILLNE